MSDDAPTLLLAALRDEMKPTVAGLRSLANVITHVTGIGPQRMTAAAGRLIDEHHPRRIILIGFSGALLPDLAAGQIIHATAVIDGAGQVVKLSDGVPVVVQDDGARDQRTTLLTVDRVVTSVEDKKKLLETHRAAAIDMESFAVARLAAQREVPLMIIRAISDTADFALPAKIGDWVNEDGSGNLGAVMRALVFKPSLLPTLLKLQSHAKTAARNLAAAVGELIDLR